MRRWRLLALAAAATTAIVVATAAPRRAAEPAQVTPAATASGPAAVEAGMGAEAPAVEVALPLGGAPAEGGDALGAPAADAAPSGEEAPTPAPTPAPHPATDTAPDATIPACAFADATIAADPTEAVSTILLDPTWRLPAAYAPPDLVDVATAGFPGPHLLRAVAIDDLAALRVAAEAAGVRLAIQSAYRSETYQDGVHRRWVEQLGAERAREVSARPGHSEHQLGTAIDVRSADGPPAWDVADWGATPEGAWVAAHAAAFGFVISYPAGERARSCYDYEPWHLRWVGREMAAAVAAAGVPLRVYLLRHHPPEEKSDR